jgi:hypothetical protein
MASYRCYRVGDTERYAAVEFIEAASDAIAIARAQRLLAKRPRNAAFELWELARQEPAEGRLKGALASRVAPEKGPETTLEKGS